jgi:hypothetical protein
MAKGIKELQRRIENQEVKVPPSKLDETINIATWNIREFGRRARLKLSLHLIAEVINQFDLISVVELRDNLSDLEKVLEILGPYWRVVYSDYNTDRGGNRERIAYVYDKRAVTFTGLAAEADPPRKKITVNENGQKVKEYVPKISWWRSPFMASFRAGSFDFIALVAHIRWDAAGGEESRIRALKLLADWVAKRRKEKHVADKDFIVLGDFNIPEDDDALFNAITSKGLKVPEVLRGQHGSNLARNKRYDQILHYPSELSTFTNNAGVLDYYQGNHRQLFPGTTMSKTDFTYQMSDHLPLWIQLNTDIEGQRLDQILNRK